MKFKCGYFDFSEENKYIQVLASDNDFTTAYAFVIPWDNNPDCIAMGLTGGLNSMWKMLEKNKNEFLGKS